MKGDTTIPWKSIGVGVTRAIMPLWKSIGGGVTRTIAFELKAELVVELLQAVRPLWSKEYEEREV